MRELIEQDGPVAVTEPTVIEVAVGAKNDRRERELRGLMRRFVLLRFEATVDADLVRIANVIALELDEASLRG